MSSGFAMAKLSDIAELNPRLAEAVAVNQPVSFVPMSAVNADTAGVDNGDYRPYGEVSKGYTPFLDGDILVAKITPCFENGKIAQVTLSNRIGFGSTEFHVVRPRAERADARYVLHFLRQRHIRLDGERKMTGSAGQRRVPEHFLANLGIPVPPLAEQRRIAAILDKADELRAKRRAVLAELELLKQSVFSSLFDSHQDKHPECPKLRLGEVVKFIDYRGISPNKQPSGIRLITARNVKRGWFEDLPKEFIPEDEYDSWMRRGMPCSGDVLFTTEGHTLGSAAKLPHFEKAALAQRLIALQPGPYIRSDYLLQLILAKDFQSDVLRRSTGSAARGISSRQLADITVNVPPLALQDEFARTVSAIERLSQKSISSLGALDAIFASLEHRAFRGEL